MSEGGSITAAMRFNSGPVADGVTLSGEWRRGDRFWEHVGDGTGAITIENTARAVHLVCSSCDEASRVVAIQEDGPPLDREWCGDDCAEHPERGAAIVVQEERPYHITRRDEAEHHELTLEVEGKGLRLHEARFS